MKEVKCVFFDLGGVLYTLDYQTVWNKLCNNSGRSLLKVQSVIYADDLFIPYETGQISSLQYYSAVKERLSLSVNFDQFKKIWNSILIKRDGMFRLVYNLRNYISILIISNTNEINAEALKDDLCGFMNDNIVFSFQVGYMKPDRRIYQIALEKAGTTAQKSIFIDDKKENVEAANSLGIVSHLYKDKEDLINFFKEYKIAEELWVQ